MADAPGVGGYAGTVEVEWSGPSMMDPKGFEGYLSKMTRGPITPDALTAAVFQQLMGVLTPDALRVTVLVECLKYGSHKLVMEGGYGDE
jgi:hypothetical protein